MPFQILWCCQTFCVSSDYNNIIQNITLDNFELIYRPYHNTGIKYQLSHQNIVGNILILSEVLKFCLLLGNSERREGIFFFNFKAM